MYKNYLMTAWKVLTRRKFFTFISLFGISITLAVLLVVSTVFDNYLFPKGPESQNDKFLYIESLSMTSKDGNSNWRSRPGYKFLETNVVDMKTPEIISIFSSFSSTASYVDGQKITSELRRTDANYWKVLNFDFVAGRQFDQQELTDGAMVAVINEKTRDNFFSNKEAVGETLIFNEQSFKVIGVVKDVSIMEMQAYADVWVPYTTAPSTQYQNDLMGGWNALLYHSNPAMQKEMQLEYVNRLKNEFVTPDPERFHTAVGAADTSFERLARQFAGRDTYDSGSGQFATLLIVLAICFMLLPSINLINLNISRIMERSSEIGVRKAFGASTVQLVLQFIVENILITALGGLIGLLLSWLILNQIELSGLMPGTEFKYNWRIFIYGFGLVFVFGLLSGAYPAFKMSRLNPVLALKGGSN